MDTFTDIVGQNWFGIARFGTPLQQTAVQRGPLPRWPQLSRVAWARENVSVFRVMKRRCPAKLLSRKTTFACECIGTFPKVNFRFLEPSKKRNVTQSSKPDDHIEKNINLALICLQADHFLLNSTLDSSVVGVAEPSWLRTYMHLLELKGNNDRCLIRKGSCIHFHIYTSGDHHCHDLTGAVFIMQREITALELDDELVCVAFS